MLKNRLQRRLVHHIVIGVGSVTFAVLTAAHAIAYQKIEKRTWIFQLVLYIVCGVVLALQLGAAFKSIRHRQWAHKNWCKTQQTTRSAC